MEVTGNCCCCLSDLAGLTSPLALMPGWGCEVPGASGGPSRDRSPCRVSFLASCPTSWLSPGLSLFLF